VFFFYFVALAALVVALTIMVSAAWDERRPAALPVASENSLSAFRSNY
jgi:hypothetical protein